MLLAPKTVCAAALCVSHPYGNSKDDQFSHEKNPNENIFEGLETLCGFFVERRKDSIDDL